MGRQFASGRSLRGAAATVLVVGFSAAACGGNEVTPPPNCLQVLPCGGDLIGSWSFLGTCANVKAQSDELAMFCPGARITASGAAITGTFTFSPDGSYTATNWHEAFAGSELLPLACLNAGSCSDLNTTINNGTQTSTTTCTGTTSCACRFRGTFIIASDFGSWYTTGTALNMFGGDTSGSFSYCVEEDRLHLLDTSTTGQPISDIVAVRI